MRGPADFYDDANQQQLYTLDRLYGLPKFVKEAQHEDPAGIRKLPSHVFADRVRCKFPCHTKQATWLAQAYFCLAEPQYSKEEQALIQDRITKQAAYWGIKGMTDRLRTTWKKLASTERPEVSDSDHALVVDMGEGKKLRRMPMPNPLSVKLAGEYLFANRYNYPYQWRRSSARRILKKAMEYDKRFKDGEKVAGASLGVLKFDDDTQEYLERASGFGMCHPKQAAEQLSRRALMISPRFNDVREKIATIAKELHEMEDCDADLLHKIAEAVDWSDRQTGLYKQYHLGVDLPEEMFFRVLEKEAEAVLNSHVTLTTGNSWPIEAFSHLPAQKIAEVLGGEVAEALAGNHGLLDLEKFAEIAPTLPRPDAELLERALKAAAEDAYAREKQGMSKEGRAPLSAHLNFDKEEWNNWSVDKAREKPREVNFNLQIPLKHPQQVL